MIDQMTKATIITDAITYIEELKTSVEELSDQLLRLDAAREDEDDSKSEEIIVEAQEKINYELTPDVQVLHVGGTKLWIKILFNKKRGAITKLIEAMSSLGLDLTNTNVTTSKGVVLVTSFAEGILGGVADSDKIKNFLLEIIHNM
ncbi:transcription factor DYT1 [Andrographis paniculata]|uniref:transcription factor DYT1 n=1 Tax=Andrographis paniculata TaxID=175694 RepID=UPI0021E96C07|nr:transcription factor DYT1 [Andrographis paniculata]